MGRRISYRPNRPNRPPEHLMVGRPQNTLSMAQIVGIVGGGLFLLLLLLALGGYFILQNRKFQQEFAPLVEVCRNKWVDRASTYSATPGQHPAVAVRDSSDGWQLDSYFLPGKVSAQSVADTQVVVCLGKVQVIFIERCGPYGSRGDPSQGTYVIDRYFYQQEAKLIEAKTGRMVAVQTFKGNAPAVCHQTERFNPKEYTTKLMGSDVSESDIRSWASSHLSIE